MHIIRRFLQCIFFWGKLTPKGDVKEAEVIVVQAMSDYVEGKSSSMNIKLAEIAERLSRLHGIPIFPQAEVGRILEARGVAVLGSTPMDSDINILSGKYTGTYGIAKLQHELCLTRGWIKVLLVTAYPHVWRAMWTYEKLGLEVIVPSDLPQLTFHRNLAQVRWRWAFTAYPLEFTVRIWSLIRGTI